MGVTITEDAIRKVYSNVALSEGLPYLYDFLVNAFLHEGISVKDMAGLMHLPLPIISAIKNEYKKLGAASSTGSGIRLSGEGREYVLRSLGYASVDTDRLQQLLTPGNNDLAMLNDELTMLAKIYDGRPTVDVSIDQSLATPETGIKRALLMLRTCGLIGEKILFVGDDDLTSLAASLIVKHLGGGGHGFTVMDIDTRILEYIKETAKNLNCEITAIEHDFRKPIPPQHGNAYDAIFTDPPYTLEGVKLFLSRGAEALKEGPGYYAYLSCGRKKLGLRLALQEIISESGFVIDQVLGGHNKYLGAQILGSTSDMYVLNTTEKTGPLFNDPYTGPIYTNEMNPTIRVYLCKHCRKQYTIGHGKPISTIQALKQKGCKCGSVKFDLSERRLI